jgi:hypothetical protein
MSWPWELHRELKRLGKFADLSRMQGVSVILSDSLGTLSDGSDLQYLCPATAGLVFGASTSTEVADFFSRFEHLRYRQLLHVGKFAVQIFYFLLHPSDA